MKRTTFLCSLILAMVSLAQAQATGQIKGTVTDASGAVVPGARVYVAKLTASVVTDQDGSFKVELSPGEYLISVESLGFLNWYQREIGVEAGQQAQVNARLLVQPRLPIVPLDYLAPSDKERYAQYLRAMKEPGLCEGTPYNKRETYRFFWLRWLEGPLLVRVDIPDQGQPQMTLKTIGHPDGSQFPRFKVRKQRPLDELDIERLRDMLSQADFWNLSPRIEDPNRVGVDGAQWITEGTKNGTCHVVDRWSPEKGPYHDLGVTFLLFMARLKLLYQEVY